IYFLKNGEIRDEFTARGLAKAKEILNILKLPEAERRAYERYKEDLHFQASMVQSTYVAGKLEGEKIGKQAGKVEMLTHLLQHRFGHLPAWVHDTIAQADLPSLEAWSQRFMDAQSLEKVFKTKDACNSG
ncbi:MAG: hypothetical protein HQL77_07980, partial [Magnetococcales bacterium]|nr:hypothetical protein [Magnetococcales bacterium]